MQIDKFKAELEQNPAYAFAWSDRSFIAAAKLDVYTRIMHGLTHEGNDEVPVTAENVVRMYRECLKDALRGAKSPSRSTSQTSNLIDDYKTAAFAEFVDHVASAITAMEIK